MSVAAERRRYKRYETELRGRIGLPGAAPSDCLIRDYCSGGMLIEWPSAEVGDAEATFSKGQAVQLKTELLTASGPRRIRIDALVAWARGGYLGLSFPKTSNAIVTALRHHDSRSQTQATPALRTQHGGEARCLAKLRHVAQGILPGLLRELLVKSGDELLTIAGKGVSDRERQQIFSDVDSIERVRSDDTLMRSVMGHALEQSAAPSSKPDGDELALVDPEDFERWLEASRVSNLLEQKFSRELRALASRLGAMRDGDNSGALTVPFEPHHFTEALKDLAKQQEFGVSARGVLFDQAAGLLQDNLGGLYQALNEALDTLGVPAATDNGKVTVLRQPQKPRSQPETPTNAADMQPVRVAGADAAGQPATPAAGMPFGIDPQLLAGLLVREAEQRTAQAQELMAYVGDIPNMTASLAGWMEQLGSLLVREVAKDERVFHDDQHPLRTIIDGLGHLQMFRRRPDLPITEDPLQQRVVELLKPVGYDNVDHRTLRRIADSLRQLTAEQSRLYQRNVERAAEASEGRDRVRRARRTVIGELNKRYAGRRVPVAVPELLDVGWRAVLELALLNGVDGGERYRELLGLLDALVGRMGGDAFEEQQLDVGAGELMARVERELATVAFDPFRRNAVEARLRAELSEVGPHRAELVKMAALAEEADEQSSAEPPAGVSETAWRSALQQCAAIKVGDHMQLLDAPEGSQELRVAWIRSDRELYSLVDFRGLRVRDISLFDVAHGLYRRRIKLDPIDGRPLSDRAVDNMLARMEQRLSHQAAHDSLTGLINRQQFHAALGKALAVPGRGADTGVLLWVDVDQFRLVNDIYGYDTGDRLLIALGQMLEGIRSAKVLAHLGSDRFAVLLPDIKLVDGEKRAQAICDAARDLAFDWQGQGMNLSVSVGVASLAAGDHGLSALLRAADAALAQAKAAGGDQAYTYRANDPGITQRSEKVQWVVRVDEALDHGELKLRCQPIVPVRPNEGLQPHYEVLLGVKSGSAESLPIAEFIEAAERYNRMRAVDRWVVRSTMEWIDAHREHMPSLHGFAVNLSGQTASDPSFVDFVRQQFQRTRVDPAWLSFEVTETAAVTDLSRTAGIIHDLKAMGCQVALDDFGSGLASYSYLRQLPVDWLKIDGAFVRKIATDQEDFAVVKSINDIGHFLGKKTIAEYVADEAILHKVREIGVDFAQGYGISPPLLMDDLLRDGDAS